MYKIVFLNTLSKKKEEFYSLLDNKKISIYACGVTPYDNSHIGHGRSYAFVDTLVRFLRFCRFDVFYVRNVTDIDDKLIVKAEKAGDIASYKAIAEHFTKLYQEEMHKLNCVDPDVEPKVTDHIDEIIDFIQGLIDKKRAYVVDNDVYFDVSSYASYGELSGKNLDDLIAGARVGIDERKQNPADFALWKGNDENLFWKSPWGYGRPGWHIECSVLAKKYAKETVDIHCGGMDLVFPHHENERAQSESLHDCTFARFWLHNALLNINKEKMSKSLGNILALSDIFETYDPMVLRYYFLQHHYRTPIEFSIDPVTGSFPGLDAAKVAYKKLIALFEGVDDVGQKELFIDDMRLRDYSCVHEMIQALSDDLNTPKMIGLVFENSVEIRRDESLRGLLKGVLQKTLGLTFGPLQKEEYEITPEISALVKARDEARVKKDWAVADKIRDELNRLGYEVQDKKLK